MSIEVMVLGAMLRLARRRRAAELGSLALRVGVTEATVKDALRRLDAVGLVERRLDREPQPPRLTMAGFAVAVGLLPGRASQATPLGRPRRVRADRAA